MPGLSYSAADYRYGFNSKEKDAAYGLLHYDYGFRIYHPGLGRFLSVDPLARSYPWYTPYQFAGNNPVKFIDIDGLEPGYGPGDSEGKTAWSYGAGKDSPQKLWVWHTGAHRDYDSGWYSMSEYLEIVKDVGANHGSRYGNAEKYPGINGTLPVDLPGCPCNSLLQSTLPTDVFDFSQLPEEGWSGAFLEAYQEAFNEQYAFVLNSGTGRVDYSLIELDIITFFQDGFFWRKGLSKAATSMGDDVVEAAAKGVRNGHLAGKVHPKTGVPFDEAGFPDFSNYLYKDGVNDVMINPTRNRANDIIAANKAAGYVETPKGFTWHHHQTTGRMQLVEYNVHRQTGHTGGFSLW